MQTHAMTHFSSVRVSPRKTGNLNQLKSQPCVWMGTKVALQLVWSQSRSSGVQSQLMGIVRQSTRGAVLLPEIFGPQPHEWDAKVLSKPLR